MHPLQGLTACCWEAHTCEQIDLQHLVGICKAAFLLADTTHLRYFRLAGGRSHCRVALQQHVREGDVADRVQGHPLSSDGGHVAELLHPPLSIGLLQQGMDGLHPAGHTDLGLRSLYMGGSRGGGRESQGISRKQVVHHARCQCILASTTSTAGCPMQPMMAATGECRLTCLCRKQTAT